jgi:hypothetical protein
MWLKKYSSMGGKFLIHIRSSAAAAAAAAATTMMMEMMLGII